ANTSRRCDMIYRCCRGQLHQQISDPQTGVMAAMIFQPDQMPVYRRKLRHIFWGETVTKTPIF
ncbi:MAG: hypothetical protein O2873_10150, partial [Proteobacteria bacterium]|nr:hypothetical protein [Pseudomonadota bacterium]